jgi:RNA polymerase subunit RPABC4/transcription elongation factor Spt4
MGWRMRRHCHNCKTFLGVWEVKCPCCRVSAMRWLHFAAVGAVSLTAAFYLLVIVQ